MEEEIKSTEEKTVSMFYGDQEIIEMIDGVDPGTKRIKTAQGSFDLPSWEALACATSWPTDASELRNLRAIYIVEKLYNVMKELNVRVSSGEIQFILQKLTTSLEHVRKTAMLRGLGVEEENDVRLHLLESKLKK